ncbi:MAG TPA: IS21 family transposase [Solirubrobacteraceae bacterium]|nr:IS21 family transposase [Solirubrobacteraceae bacterium]
MSRVEQFEQIRRDHVREGLSIRELAKRHGVHRRAVRQALESAVPPPKRAPESRPAPKLGRYRPVIDAWLEADRKAPRKQRHSARRIWQRLVEEHGAEVSERQVCRYVHDKRRELSDVGEVFVPLIADAGVEAEVDWGQAKVVLRGELVGVHLFQMRACFSGAAFVMAFRDETQQAFLEGHVRALEWFAGVFDVLRYDNLKSAVARVLKGRRRVESDRFVALRSHYRFESSFCLSGVKGAHEKGGIEGEVGRFRRRHLVPVPEVSSIEELNELLEEACWVDLDRTVTGQSETVGERLDRERLLLNTLPREPHPTWEEATPRVDAKALATVRTNRYSVPASLAGLKIRARIGASEISFWHDGKVVASHERLHGHHQISAQLDHYLDLLTRKPGALARSLALRQERDRGDWPACFDQLWTKIQERSGGQEAARQMVDVLLLCREHDTQVVELAVRGALAAGAHDGRAVKLLVDRSARPQPAALQLDAKLLGIGSPPPTASDISGYDRLRDTETGR